MSHLSGVEEETPPRTHAKAPGYGAGAGTAWSVCSCRKASLSSIPSPTSRSLQACSRADQPRPRCSLGLWARVQTLGLTWGGGRGGNLASKRSLWTFPSATTTSCSSPPAGPLGLHTHSSFHLGCLLPASLKPLTLLRPNVSPPSFRQSSLPSGPQSAHTLRDPSENCTSGHPRPGSRLRFRDQTLLPNPPTCSGSEMSPYQ